ncbi:MAG: SpoIIE family protein phosphatase [Verrucomicrobiae bacterium]|nr:SpoIIE family protein phosphatase [Verrucomicrobiae bacterium]
MSTRVPLRALILEDSEFDARVMVQALKAAGYEVHSRRIETADAMEEALAGEGWDIILADYNMPSFNASEALRLLQGKGLDIPFIIVSGGIGEDVAVAAMKAGAHDYVMKGQTARLLPAVERELREAVERRARREAERRLRESELRYRSLWETSPDGVLVCDESGAIAFANPAAERMFGVRADELAGRTIRSLEPEGGGGLQRALASVGQGDGSGAGQVPVEGPALGSGGLVLLLEVTSSRLELPERRWIVLFARDITEKRRNETALLAREEQMRAAREIQQRLFPREAPVVPGFDIAGISVPADATGGDYYDFLTMPDGQVGLVVADVSGHGLGPSLLMVETRGLLRGVAHHCSDPAELVSRVNRVISEDVQGEYYVTLVLIRLDPATGTLVHASAGHPPALLLDAGGRVRSELRRTGGPLGFGMGAAHRSVQPIRMMPGEILVLYTDGILEAHPTANGFEAEGDFGLERMLDVVRAHAERPAAEIVRALCEAAGRYAGPEPIDDDLTVVVVKAMARS